VVLVPNGGVRLGQKISLERVVCCYKKRDPRFSNGTGAGLETQPNVAGAVFIPITTQLDSQG